MFFFYTHTCHFSFQARQCCDEGECLLAKQDMDKPQSKEDAEKTVQSIKNFLEMALPFLSYNIENLSCEFDVILSPELKVRGFIFQRNKSVLGPLGLSPGVVPECT